MLERVGRRASGRRRGAAVVGLGAAALLVAGCGQTDFATGVGTTGATLNATITGVDGGGARAWFQFWSAAAPGAKQRTAAVPVTAAGPFSARVGGLAPETTYAFRVCGRRGTVTACAQTRRFRTSHDSVQAYGDTDLGPTDALPPSRLRGLDVRVLGRPAGDRLAATLDVAFPTGSLTAELGSTATPAVTCAAVAGHVAVVRFRNLAYDPVPPPLGATGTAVFVDGGPVGSGLDRVAASYGGSPVDPSVCSVPADVGRLLVLAHGDISVNDVSTAP